VVWLCDGVVVWCCGVLIACFGIFCGGFGCEIGGVVIGCVVVFGCGLEEFGQAFVSQENETNLSFLLLPSSSFFFLLPSFPSSFFFLLLLLPYSFFFQSDGDPVDLVCSNSHTLCNNEIAKLNVSTQIQPKMVQKIHSKKGEKIAQKNGNKMEEKNGLNICIIIWSHHLESSSGVIIWSHQQKKRAQKNRKKNGNKMK